MPLAGPAPQGPGHRGLVRPEGGVGAIMVPEGRTYAASDVRFWLLANIFAVYPIATSPATARHATSATLLEQEKKDGLQCGRDEVSSVELSLVAH